MDLAKLINRYNELGIAEVVDHEKFNLISIVHHSTKIEGSTLTELETRVLLEDGLNPNNKALHDTLMATDHYAALLFTLKEARAKRPISIELLKEINSLVVRIPVRFIILHWVPLMLQKENYAWAMYRPEKLIFQTITR